MGYDVSPLSRFLCGLIERGGEFCETCFCFLTLKRGISKGGDRKISSLKFLADVYGALFARGWI